MFPLCLHGIGSFQQRQDDDESYDSFADDDDSFDSYDDEEDSSEDDEGPDGSKIEKPGVATGETKVTTHFTKPDTHANRKGSLPLLERIGF